MCCIFWTPENNTTFFAHIGLSAYHKWWQTWRPLACYTFIKIKLASCHLLLYVVYTCRKSFSFINAFACYEQKCKLAPFNLAHLVHQLHSTEYAVKWKHNTQYTQSGGEEWKLSYVDVASIDVIWALDATDLLKCNTRRFDCNNSFHKHISSSTFDTTPLFRHYTTFLNYKSN